MVLACATARATAPGHFVLHQIGDLFSTRHSGTMPRSCLLRSASSSPADVRRLRLTSPYTVSVFRTGHRPSRGPGPFSSNFLVTSGRRMSKLRLCLRSILVLIHVNTLGR